MEEKRAGWHKRLAAVIIILFVVAAIVTGISLFSESRKNVYQNEYYSIELPEGWTAETEFEIRRYPEVFFVSPDGTEAACIEPVYENFEHGGVGVYSLLVRSEIMGNHGSIKSSKIVMSNDSQIPFYRVVMEYELPPGLEWRGMEPEPDKLYFLYLSDDDLFICIRVLDNTLWDEVEEIVKTMRLVSK